MVQTRMTPRLGFKCCFEKSTEFTLALPARVSRSVDWRRSDAVNNARLMRILNVQSITSLCKRIWDLQRGFQWDPVVLGVEGWAPLTVLIGGLAAGAIYAEPGWKVALKSQSDKWGACEEYVNDVVKLLPGSHKWRC